MNLKICTLVCMLGSASTACLAAEFTADFVQVIGPRTETGKLYMKGDNVRLEITRGTPTISIFRADKNVLWYVIPADKTYSEIPGISFPMSDSEWSGLKASGFIKLAGEETVNGHLCDKYTSSTSNIWESKKLKVVIKMETGGASRQLTEYKNIKEESVPDSTFDLPAGYKKVDNK